MIGKCSVIIVTSTDRRMISRRNMSCNVVRLSKNLMGVVLSDYVPICLDKSDGETLKCPFISWRFVFIIFAIPSVSLPHMIISPHPLQSVVNHFRLISSSFSYYSNRTWYCLLQVDYWCFMYTYSDGTHITVTLTEMWGCTYFWPHPKGMTSHSPPAWDCGSLLVVRGIVWLYIRVYVNSYEYNHDHHVPSNSVPSWWEISPGSFLHLDFPVIWDWLI